MAGIKRITGQRAGYAREQIQDHKARRAIDSFNLLADDPQRIIVQQKMQEADVYEDRRHQPPVLLLLIDEVVVLCAEGAKHLRIGAESAHTAGEPFEQEDA